MSEKIVFSGKAGRPIRPMLAREMPGIPWPVRTGGNSGDLPDTNVWLALAVQEHPWHDAARDYWAETQIARRSAPAHENVLWFCRTTMLGLLRRLSEPRIVGQGALPPGEALVAYQRFRNLPAVGLLPEQPGSDEVLAAYVASRIVQQRQWTDAWLAAQASTSGLRLVTFDKEFLRFGLERCLVLPSQ